MLTKCIRGFEVAKPFDDPDCKYEVNLPRAATQHSAGYDFFALHDTFIQAGEIRDVETGIKAYMQPGEVLILANRSSNPVKKGLELANGIGIVDQDYYSNPSNDGHIMFRFKATRDTFVRAGDAIGQGMFTTYLAADAGNCTTKRTGGFGSSDAHLS